jgi:transketolase
MVELYQRIIDIAYKYKASHLGSYFSSVDIIDKIFTKKDNDDIFILSCGHAALALYCIIEKYHGKDAEMLFKKHGGHPHRDEKNHIHCSTGSLGLGITVAVGRALANPSRKVYVLLSDGECAEGSVWESLRFIKEQNIENIEVYVNANGYAAYDSIDIEYLEKRLKLFLPSIHVIRTKVNQFSFLNGLNAHYHIMNKEDYEEACGLLT